MLLRSQKKCCKYCMFKSLAFKDFALSYFIIFESRGLRVNLFLLFLIITTPKPLQNRTHFFVFSTKYIISYSCICCRDMSDIEFRWQICTLIIQKLLLKVMFILDLWYHRCSKQLRHKSTLITVHWLKYIGASCQQFWPQIMRCQAWKWVPFSCSFYSFKGS